MHWSRQDKLMANECGASEQPAWADDDRGQSVGEGCAAEHPLTVCVRKYDWMRMRKTVDKRAWKNRNGFRR